MNATKTSFITTLALLFLLVVTSPAFSKLAVNPLTLKYRLGSGESGSKVLTLSNTGEGNIEVGLRLADWFRTTEGDLRILQPGSLERSSVDWVQFSPNSLTLQPDESVEVPIEVSVPNSDITGDHWATILVTKKAEKVDVEGRVNQKITVGYVVKILVQDPQVTKKSGAITNISLEKADPLTLNVEFKNNGKTHLHATGTVELRNLQGETVESFQVNKFPALPGEVREIKVTANPGNKLEQGQYYAIAVFDYGGEHRVQGGRPIFLSMPFGSYEAPPRDLDGDGLYEDVNGDGELTTDDSSALALNLDAEVVKNSPSLFDFNNDGEVSFEDASKLLEMVEQKEQNE